MQDYVCLMRKLLENGILTEKDSFALVNAEEAEHISLPFRYVDYYRSGR